MSTSYANTAQHNFLNKYSRLSPTSNEWARIEYLMQLSLGSTTAIVKNIWSIANPHMTLSFEKQSKVELLYRPIIKGLLVLDSWLESGLLDENNRVEKVCSKGFEFPQSGLLFPTGHIKLSEGNIGRGRLYEFFLLKIAVGKSYCLPSKSSLKEKYKLPFGFDSIYLYNEDEDPMTGIFKHDYILFENSRVLPCYIVHYEFDQRKEDGLTPPLCDICNDNVATIYCKADDMSLCYDCDEEHHLKGGKLVSKHIRVPITEKPKTFGNCNTHPDQKLELYCTIDHTPLCVYCKIAGSHSSGESSGHPLVKISDAYQKAIGESREIDPLVEKRKNQLAELLQQIDIRIKDVNKNASYVEERIYQVLQEALLQLQEETQKKMSYLIGDQLELKRQYDQIQWMESFLKYQQEVLSPSDYLNSWSRHMGMRNEVLSVSNLPLLTNVQPDIRLEGKINVVTEGTIKSLVDMGQDQDDQQPNEMGQQDPQKYKYNKLIQDPYQALQGSVGDKNQKMIKSIVQQSLVKPQQEIQGQGISSQALWKGQPKQQNQQGLPASRVFKKQFDNDPIEENEQYESGNSNQNFNNVPF